MRLATRLCLLILLAATPLLPHSLFADPPITFKPSPIAANVPNGFVIHLTTPISGCDTIVIENVEKTTGSTSVVVACFIPAVTSPDGSLIFSSTNLTPLPKLTGNETQGFGLSHGYLAGIINNPNGNISASRFSSAEVLGNAIIEHSAAASTIPWTTKALQNLPNTNRSIAYDVNVHLVCVGTDFTNNFAHQFAVSWDSAGNVTDLNTLDNNSTLKLTTANAINDSGLIVGQALGMSGFTPFLYENGTATDLGSLGGSFGQANDINSSGQIVGQSSLANFQSRAFLYANGMMTNLGTLPGGNQSAAQAINDSGLIVGFSNLANDAHHAVLWDTNGTIHDLNDLAPNSTYTYTSATTINNHGDIFVQAVNKSNAQFGLFLSPSGASGSAPTIQSNPGNVIASVGGTATFKVTATGTAPLKYQWYFDKTKKISGATSANYTITKVAATNAGNYTAIVTNSLGSTTSTAATLTVLTPPTITGQPKAQTAVSGGNATFSVTATGTPTLNFYWQFSKTTSNYSNITMTTVSSLTIKGVTSANQGNYRVIVSNVAGATKPSSAAKLTVK